jgi:hypothetical protein
MNLKNVLSTTRVALFATMLLAACFTASPANAQSAFDGRFTLPETAYWEQHVLPAGSYQLSITATGLPSVVVVRDTTSGKTVATLRPQIRELSTTGATELLVGTRGQRRVIYSLKVPRLGMVFISDPSLAQAGQQGEARQTQVVPVVVATK